MESNGRYFRRRAAEEFAAAQRAVTPAGRDRHVDLAKRFLAYLDEEEAQDILFDWGFVNKRAQSRKVPQMSATA